MRVACRSVFRAAFTAVLALQPASFAEAHDYSPREDLGVAAVDTRTGKVLWEVWRLDEVPSDTSRELKASVLTLLEIGEKRIDFEKNGSMPSYPVSKLDIQNPWPTPNRIYSERPSACSGKNHIYYRHPTGIIAFDRTTGKEVWRYVNHFSVRTCSYVLEIENGLALIQIGCNVPRSLRAVLIQSNKPPHLTIPKLEPSTIRQQVAAVMLLHYHGDGYHRPEVKQIADKLRKEKNDPAAEPMAKAIEKLLANWPKKRKGPMLIEGCIASLIQADEGNPLKEYAWPGAQRMMLWCLMQELIYGRIVDGYTYQGYNFAYHVGWTEESNSLSDSIRGKLIDHCRNVVASGPKEEKPFAASVLLSSAVGWSKLTDEERKKLFLSKDESVWRWAALSMVKNGRREQLMDWASERPTADHFDVIWVLRNNKPKEWTDKELAFWLARARQNPGGVASVLWSDGLSPIAFRETIRSYLEKEVAKPTITEGGKQSANDLFAAVFLLDSWKNPDDDQLLLAYLKHPLHFNSTISGNPPKEVRDFQLRGHVRVLLEKRGVQIPEGIVYREDAGAGKK